MDGSLPASEDTKGRFILDGGQEILHKRLQVKQHQEEKNQYIIMVPEI